MLSATNGTNRTPCVAQAGLRVEVATCASRIQPLRKGLLCRSGEVKIHDRRQVQVLQVGRGLPARLLETGGKNPGSSLSG